MIEQLIGMEPKYDLLRQLHGLETQRLVIGFPERLARCTRVIEDTESSQPQVSEARTEMGEYAQQFDGLATQIRAYLANDGQIYEPATNQGVDVAEKEEKPLFLTQEEIGQLIALLSNRLDDLPEQQHGLIERVVDKLLAQRKEPGSV